jgi:hypothetical protein
LVAAVVEVAHLQDLAEAQVVAQEVETQAQLAVRLPQGRVTPEVQGLLPHLALDLEEAVRELQVSRVAQLRAELPDQV